jgi:low affinity Fe/Cu permease
MPPNNLAGLSNHSKKSKSLFLQFAKWTSMFTGHPMAFLLAFSIIIAWIVTGPIFQFSDTWQLVINTATTIVTFLMVFLIQNTQNRDTQAIHLKLDELIRTTKGHNALMDLEELTPHELNVIKARYEELAEKARDDLRHGLSDTGSPEF